MEKYTWIIKVVLALFFLMPGIVKIRTPKGELVRKGNMPPDGNIAFIRILGVCEILGCVAMIVSLWFRELSFLSVLAGIGFGLVMIGATYVHVKKEEFKKVPILLFVLGLSAVVVIQII